MDNLWHGSDLMGIQQVLMSYGGGGASSTLYDEIMADSPEWYVRLNETSGTSANNETGGADGTYGAGVVLNQTAIYTGGDPCILCQKAAGNDYVSMTNGFPVSTGALTFMAIILPTTTVGVQSIICKDTGSSPRSFQWRLNGTSLEWVKIVGGVAGVTKTSAVTAGVACMLHVTVSAGGAVEFFKDGASIHTATIAAANYANTTDLRVGYNSGPAASMDGYFSECAGFGAVLSSARIAAHAAAAGF
jgi:hypothetical protein